MELAARLSVPERTPSTTRPRVDWLFRELMEDLAQPERTSIVVLEDLHWADEATLDFVRFIGRRIQRTRVPAHRHVSGR